MWRSASLFFFMFFMGRWTRGPAGRRGFGLRGGSGDLNGRGPRFRSGPGRWSWPRFLPDRTWCGYGISGSRLGRRPGSRLRAFLLKWRELSRLGWRGKLSLRSGTLLKYGPLLRGRGRSQWLAR
ncbi:MAG: hypothetical protein M3N93_02035 [Acidobacteriota bacterium]|nr:hypothetical protein [Acidobacteriota bacterium]